MFLATCSLLLSLLVGASPSDSTLPTAAVVPFEVTGISDQDAVVLVDRFRSELANVGAYRLVERTRMDEVLREQGLQQSGCTSTECAVETGRILGVGRIVAGSLARIGNTWTVTARVIDVETGAIGRTAVVDLSESVDALLTRGMRLLAERLVKPERTATSPAAFLEELSFLEIPPIVASVSPPETAVPPRAVPPGSIPFQIVLAVVAIPPARSVNGFSVNLGWGRLEQFRGVQAGVINQVDSAHYGIQAGVLNFVGEQRGVQAGVVSSATSTRGIQAGVLNLSGPLHGIQAGVVNLAGESSSLQVGLVNVWKRNGQTRFMPFVGGLF